MCAGLVDYVRIVRIEHYPADADLFLFGRELGEIFKRSADRVGFHLGVVVVEEDVGCFGSEGFHHAPGEAGAAAVVGGMDNLEILLVSLGEGTSVVYDDDAVGFREERSQELYLLGYGLLAAIGADDMCQYDLGICFFSRGDVFVHGINNC